MPTIDENKLAKELFNFYTAAMSHLFAQCDIEEDENKAKLVIPADMVSFYSNFFDVSLYEELPEDSQTGFKGQPLIFYKDGLKMKSALLPEGWMRVEEVKAGVPCTVYSFESAPYKLQVVDYNGSSSIPCYALLGEDPWLVFSVSPENKQNAFELLVRVMESHRRENNE